MKKIILTLLVSLLCTIVVKAFVVRDSLILDTLPERIINGLEVIPIKISYYTSGRVNWKLRTVDFNKKIQKFNGKYPSEINWETISNEVHNTIRCWQDSVWHEVVPAEIKALPDKILGDAYPPLRIQLYVNKNGHIFAADFCMTDEEFQYLNSLPLNMLKDFYDDLLRLECKVIQQVEFRYIDFNESGSTCGSLGEGKEYIVMTLDWFSYDLYGTQNENKILKMYDEGRDLLRERSQKRLKKK